jgi:hypothetical protein
MILSQRRPCVLAIVLTSCSILAIEAGVSLLDLVTIFYKSVSAEKFSDIFFILESWANFHLKMT